MSGYVSSHLKDMNRQVVYNYLCSNSPTSKAEISKETGISAPTVIKIVTFLSEAGLIKETEATEQTNALGRKPQMLLHNKNRFYSVGILHEGDYIKVGLVNLKNEIIGYKRIKSKNTFIGFISEDIYHIINELLIEKGILASDLCGVGIGIPGIYDVRNKKIITAPLVGVTEMLDISEQIENIERYYHVNVIVENDLNMEVMGEFKSLKLPIQSDLIYVSLGTGLGSGVILHGKIRRGKHYMCGEIGYLSFSEDYVRDKSSAGWLETKINLAHLEQRFAISVESDNESKNIADAIAYTANSVALCINNLMVTFDCDNISVGGEMFDVLGEGFFGAIKKRVEEISVGEVKLRMKSCNEPGVIGAASLVTEIAIKRILADS